MDRNSSTSSSERVPLLPAAALLALVVIVAIEGLFVLNRHQFRGAPEKIMSIKRSELTYPRYPEDVVIYGDSRMFSVDPEAVEKALGGNLKVTNYAWYFSGFELYELMLRAHLEYKGKPPELIIFSLMPEFLVLPNEGFSLAEVPAYRPRAYNTIPADVLWSTFWEKGDWANLWHYFTYHLTPPSTKFRNRAMGSANRLLRGRDWEYRLPGVWKRMGDFQARGAFTLFDRKSAMAAESDLGRHYPGPFELQPPPPSIEAFYTFVDRTADLDIELLLLNPPLGEALHRQYERYGVPEAFEEFVADLDARYPHLTVAPPVLNVYPTHLFGDIHHINTAGDELFREQYTEVLSHYGETRFRKEQEAGGTEE